MHRRHLITVSLALLPFATAAIASEVTTEFITTSLLEDGKPLRLELQVRKPPGPGPFPTVLFNHGSTGRGNNPELFRRCWSSPTVATFFDERGWMVIFPQRRGRGASCSPGSRAAESWPSLTLENTPMRSPVSSISSAGGWVIAAPTHLQSIPQYSSAAPGSRGRRCGCTVTRTPSICSYTARRISMRSLLLVEKDDLSHIGCQAGTLVTQ